MYKFCTKNVYRTDMYLHSFLYLWVDLNPLLLGPLHVETCKVLSQSQMCTVLAGTSSAAEVFQGSGTMWQNTTVFEAAIDRTFHNFTSQRAVLYTHRSLCAFGRLK